LVGDVADVVNRDSAIAVEVVEVVVSEWEWTADIQTLTLFVSI
jgi:hypothetical protein